MTGKEFFNRVTNSHSDVLQLLLNFFKKEQISFCVIGGFDVNAYVDPVIDLDLDFVIAEKMEQIVARAKGFFKNSDLRLQFQTDKRYRDFLKGAKIKEILGYKLPVARIEDIFQSKVWAASDETRCPSKRQKDLADILRLIEVKPGLRKFLPEKLKKQLRIN